MITGDRQAEVAVVAPMPIESEIPDEQVRSKGSDPRGERPPGCIDVHLVTPGPGLETTAVDGHVHVGPVGRDMISPTQTHVQDRRIVLIHVSGAITVVRISVQDGNAAQPMGLPEPLDGDGDVIEAAIAAKKVPTGVVASGPDEGKGIDQLPEPNMFRRRNHSSDRVASGRSEGVIRHFRDQVRRVDLENQLIGHRLRLEQHHLRKGE